MLSPRFSLPLVFFTVKNTNKGEDNVFVGTLQENLNKISKDKTTVLYCQSGDRTSIGYSLLAKNGFKNMVNYSGGMNEWVNSGKPIVSEN